MACSTTRTPSGVLVLITPRQFSIRLRAFLVFWIAAWMTAAWLKPLRTWDSWLAIAVFGLVTILFAYQWVWNMRGREELNFDSDLLSYRRLLFGYSRVQRFQMSEITGPRFVHSRSRGMGGSTPSGLGFSYENKSFRIGDYVTWAEAKAIASAMEEAFPEHATTWRNYDEGIPDSDSPVAFNLR
jgi:hypothetical protein